MIATISCLLALAHAGLGLSFGSQPKPLGEIPVEHTKIVMPGVMPQEVRSSVVSLNSLPDSFKEVPS